MKTAGSYPWVSVGNGGGLIFTDCETLKILRAKIVLWHTKDFKP